MISAQHVFFRLWRASIDVCFKEKNTMYDAVGLKLFCSVKKRPVSAAHLGNSVPHLQCQRGMGMQESVMGFSKWRERMCVTTYRDSYLFSKARVFTSSLLSKVKADLKQNYVSHYCLNWFRQLLLLMVSLLLNSHE